MHNNRYTFRIYKSFHLRTAFQIATVTSRNHQLYKSLGNYIII